MQRVLFAAPASRRWSGAVARALRCINARRPHAPTLEAWRWPLSVTFEDCLGLCDLNEEQVLAIAEHEHIPAIAALELANYLIRSRAGEDRVKAMIYARALASGAKLNGAEPPLVLS